MNKTHIALSALALFFTVNTLADNSLFESVKKACANLPNICESVAISPEDIYTLTCKDGSKNYIYPPSSQPANKGGLVSTDQPNSGSYWCVPDGPQHLHPENMIKSYCKEHSAPSEE
jgi:hypothetical protein